jgi:hypothetical protein
MIDDWIPHDGGECPVDHYTAVACKFRNGEVSDFAPACFWIDRWSNRWEHRTPDHGEDIIAYMVILDDW